MAGTSIVEAGRGIKTPSQGSTAGDLGSVVTGVLAGIDQRRRENQAKALEEAKIDVQRQMAEAQAAQADAYGRQVDNAAADADRRFLLDSDAAAREEEAHGLNMQILGTQAAQASMALQSVEESAPALRSMLRRASLRDPALPWSVSDLDNMDPLMLRDTYEKYWEIQQSRAANMGAAAGAAANTARMAYEGALERQRQAMLDMQNASAIWRETYAKVTSGGFWAQEGEDGLKEIRFDLDLTPAERAEKAGQSVELQDAQRMRALAQENLRRAMEETKNAGLIQQETLSNIVSAMGGTVDSVVVSTQPREVPVEELDSLFISFQNDPGFFRQQMETVARRIPGAEEQFMRYSSVDQAQLDAAMNRQTAETQGAIVESGMNWDVNNGAPRQAFSELVNIFRNPGEIPRAASRAAVYARQLREGGMTLQEFQTEMEYSAGPSAATSPIMQFIIDSWPNRIGGGR